MADILRVTPTTLSQAGNEVADHGEDLLARQQSCHGEAADAQPGWVGSSAGALSSLLDRWQSASEAHFRRFGKHSCDMHFAAAGFADTEDHNVAAVRDVGEAVSGQDPRV